MIDYQVELNVNRPPSEVFRFTSDVQRMEQWTEMTNTRLLTNGSFGVGSQVQTTIQFGPSRQAMTFEVVAYEQERRIGWKTISDGGVQWDADYTFEPQGDQATHLLSIGQIRLKGLLKPLEGLLAGEIRNGEQKELEKLKQLIEAG